MNYAYTAQCIYGHTPFLAEEGGRQQTKVNIVVSPTVDHLV